MQYMEDARHLKTCYHCYYYTQIFLLENNMHGPHPHERIRQLNKTVPSKGLMCYQRRLPREGRFMVDLERWIVDVKVACEVLEAGAVCHSPPCPQHLV